MSRAQSETGSAIDRPSTFGERFRFARDRQWAEGRWQEDQELAALVDLKPSQITEYKSRVDAPPVARVLPLARAIGAPPGWLAFGERGDEQPPEGFARWLRNHREREAERERPVAKGRVAEVHYGEPPKGGRKKPAQKRGRAS